MTVGVRRWLRIGLATSALFVSCTGVVGSVGASASQKAISCSIVSPAEIKATLGLSVSKPKAEQLALGLGLNCTYTIAKTYGILNVALNFKRPVTTAQQLRSSVSPGGTTKPVKGLGQAAYCNIVGSGKSATITLYVLQDKTSFYISVAAPLAKVEALAREILPEV